MSVVLAIPASASQAVVVSPNHMHGWFFFNDNTNGPGTGHMVSGPGHPPLGSGSAELGVVDANDRQALGTQAYIGTRLADVTHLSYWTYQTDASHAMPLQFAVRYRPTDTLYGGRLVFEPGNGNPSPASGIWQRWSPMTGKWWASKTNAAGSGGLCPQSSPCTWAQVKTNWPNASVSGTLLFKAGGGWTAWKGNVDALTIGVQDHGTKTYDFEPSCDQGGDGNGDNNCED
jgi:hypothetical protein